MLAPVSSTCFGRDMVVRMPPQIRVTTSTGFGLPMYRHPTGQQRRTAIAFPGTHWQPDDPAKLLYVRESASAPPSSGTTEAMNSARTSLSRRPSSSDQKYHPLVAFPRT